MHSINDCYAWLREAKVLVELLANTLIEVQRLETEADLAKHMKNKLQGVNSENNLVLARKQRDWVWDKVLQKTQTQDIDAADTVILRVETALSRYEEVLEAQIKVQMLMDTMEQFDDIPSDDLVRARASTEMANKTVTVQRELLERSIPW